MSIKKWFINRLLILIFLMAGSCQNTDNDQKVIDNKIKDIIVGANQTEKYIDLLKGKRIAIVANNTSVIFKKSKTDYQHLVDSLLSLDIKIEKIFAPEHGFRGVSDAGEYILDNKDTKTDLPLISLYGKNEKSTPGQIYNYKKPTKEQLHNIDILVFDIQDVGVRFYTYISTLFNVMEACAENNIPIIVLDRPNPNGHYVDGPVLEKESKSFAGLGPIPIVYGMTIGEYGQMVNGEKWMKDSVQCDLTIIPLKNYTHTSSYSLPLRPSPNLPNDKSINLYASVCMFEGTNVSCGRGTEKQFQIFGSPFLPNESYNFSFVPQPNFGSKSPKYQNLQCNGLDLSKTKKLNSLNLDWLINAYNATSEKDEFFIEKSFNKLAGTTKLKEQIEKGLTLEEIKATWQKDLEAFKMIRNKYLLY